MKEILVLGLGKVGSLVGTLLSENFSVTGIDQKEPHYNYKLPYETIKADVSNSEKMYLIMKDYDAVVSALPFL